MEGGMISVDRWARGSQAYFLTHLHSDHTHGLSSSWSYGPLFCSRTSAKLFPLKFPSFNFSLLRIVDIGKWHQISLLSPSPIHFMPIDALHCPGAVMFLFRGVFGHVLYTGDFRWEAIGERSMKSRNMLLEALNGANVDVLYLDNTYCNPAYCFPLREVAVQQAIEIIASHPEHDIIIGIDSLGKEDLLLQIARCLKIKIWVWPERLQTMHLLGYLDIFTTRTSLTRVRAVPRYSFNFDTLEALNKQRPTIGIMASGLPWVVKPLVGKSSNNFSLSSDSINTGRLAGTGTRNDVNVRSVEKIHNFIFSVPYSDHSCFVEIKDFVKLIKPYQVKGIVSRSPWYVDPRYYLSHLLRSNHGPQATGLNSETLQEGDKADRNEKTETSNSAGTVRKKSATEVNFFGARIRRVSALRRIKRGAKIECDISD